MQMEVRDDLLRSRDSPLGGSKRRREYFDVLYLGLCGAHIAAAVVARGGIVADSKDGWLRKVCCCCCCCCCCCVDSPVDSPLLLCFLPFTVWYTT